MRLQLSVPVVLALLVGPPAAGLTPYLVKDINSIPKPADSDPRNYVTTGGLTFFSAHDSETGRELWRTDGTAAGTFPVVDACPGECSGDPGFVARTERSYFFRVPQQALTSSLTPSELWVTGGLPSDTFRLSGKILFARSGRRVWVAAQGLLYFTADDGIHGMELWRSDGTPNGTFMVADVRPGPGGLNPTELTDFNGRLFFRADDGVQGPALWTSDGTARGTRLVRDPGPGLASEYGPEFLRVVGRNLFFTAVDPRRGDQIWKSDGTSRGTTPLASFRRSLILDVTVLGNRLLFITFDRVKGMELWASDGTSRGTRVLTNFAHAEAFYNFALFILPRSPLGSRMVFQANDGVHGLEPWITDGTPRGTRLLRDICPGACSGSRAGSLFELTAVAGNLLFFQGTDGGHGDELWVTDGTAAGTRMLQDLCPGSCGSSGSIFNAGEGKIFFQAIGSDHKWQLWHSDGTAQGTIRLTNFDGPGRFGAGTVFGKALLFTADDGQHGRELWRSDGRPESTRLLADLNDIPDIGGSAPFTLRAAAGNVYFLANDGRHGRELWVSDGTEAGTRLAHEFSPGAEPTDSKPPSIEASAEAGGLFFFFSVPDESGRPFWRTDGTEAGTLRLDSENLRIDASVGLRAVGNQVFFAARDEDHGSELWVTDGTPGGTRLLADLEPGFIGSEPTNLTVFQGRLYFAAGGFGFTSRKLWRSDGTPGGTVIVKDINHPLLGSAEHAGRLYFFASNEEFGLELWSTDGTTVGTLLAAGILPEPRPFIATHLISAGSRLFFAGRADHVHGLWVTDGTAAGTRHLGTASVDEDTPPAAFNGDLYFVEQGSRALWKSDGTEAGTAQLLDRNGQEILEPRFLQVFAGRLFFTTPEGWLYQSDGTAAGTFKLLELAAPGEAPLASFELVPAGSRLFFRKWDHATGSELWALE